MQILVTGATGLLGNNVVRELLARQIRPRVLIRETSDPRPLEGLEVDLFYGDIRDATAVQAACQGVDPSYDFPIRPTLPLDQSCVPNHSTAALIPSCSENPIRSIQ